MLTQESHRGVYHITLNRNERANAPNADLAEALLGVVETACLDPSIRTLVLRCSGKNFCSGFYLSDIENQSDADLLHRFVRIEMLLATIWNLPIRTIAVVSRRIDTRRG